jgi:SPP1 gp7 family putative phage head morphogenesis protein
VKTPKQIEVRYRKALLNLVRNLKKDVFERIIPLLRIYEPEFVNDAYATALSKAFDNLRNRYANITREAESVASAFVTSSDATNKRKFYSTLQSAFGVNVQSLVQQENLGDILIAKTRENVALIQSIPDEFLKKVETIVFEGTTQGSRTTSMIKELQHIGKVTENRARLISRDQTSKMNSSLNQQRQQNLGVEEYIWRTAEDDRVRPDHASKDGKTFRWDKPPKDTGHPGEDIQCRCIAQPLIKI